MGDLAKQALEHTEAFFCTESKAEAEKQAQKELIINNLQRKITDYIVQISGKNKLSEEDNNLAYTYVQAAIDIERVGDHTENIVELTQSKITKGVHFSEAAMEDMREMFEKTISIYENALKCLESHDEWQAKEVVEKDDEIDDMERNLRRLHINRLNEGKCSGEAGSIYLDVLNSLERVGDHAVNIAQYVLGKK